MHLVFGFGERRLGCAAEAVDLEHANGGEENRDIGRRRIPERGERPDLAVTIGVKHALVPTARVFRMIGILANNIQERL